MIVSNILTVNVLSDSGISGLLGGVNKRNSSALFLSEFIMVSLVLFGNLGQCEKHLNGYGKYQLLRHKKRQIMIFGIYNKTVVYICFLTLSRMLIYTIILMIRNDNLHISVKDTLTYMLMYVLILTLLSLIQYYIELKYSSAVGLIITMIYYLFSISLGGILAEKEVYRPIVLLLPNYYMKNRFDVIIKEAGINEWILYLILISGIFSVIIFSCMALKKKDIF